MIYLEIQIYLYLLNPNNRIDKESSLSNNKKGSNNFQEQLVPDKPEYP